MTRDRRASARPGRVGLTNGRGVLAWLLVAGLIGLMALGARGETGAMARTAEADRAAPANAASPQQALPDPPPIYLPWVARRDTEALVLAEQVGGTTRALAVAGDRVYAAIDDRILAFDVSAAKAFGPVGRSEPIGTQIQALLRDGDLLYAAAGSAGVFTFDISDPNTPQQVHGLALPGGAGDLALASGQLLVALADGPGSMAVLSLADPRRPRLTARLEDGASARRLAVVDGLVYLTQSGCDLNVVSFQAPAELGRVARLGTICADVSLGDLSPLGDFLAPTSASAGGGPWQVQGIWRLDDPRQPRYDDGPAIRAGRIGQLLARGSTVYAATSGSLGQDLADGLWVGGLPGGSGEPYGELEGAGRAIPGGLVALALDEAGQRLYGGGSRVNLVAFDVSEARAPVETARYPGISGAGRVAAGRDQVYVVEDAPAAMAIVSTDGPWPARRTGSFPLTAEALTADRVTLLADPARRYAYLLYYNALQVIETTSPDQAAARRLLAMPDITTLALDDRWIYAAGDGLRVLDISIRDEPRELAYARQAGSALALAVEGQRAYVAQREPTGARPTSLYVWDVGDRAAPRRVGQLPEIGPTVGLAALGGFVWHLYDYTDVSGQQARGAALATIDARDPADVHELVGMRIAFAGRPRKVVRDATAQRLYVLEASYFDRRTRMQRGRDGVQVLDISQPERPRQLRFVPIQPVPRDIDARGGKLYLVGDSGLGIIDIATP